MRIFLSLFWAGRWMLSPMDVVRSDRNADPSGQVQIENIVKYLLAKMPIGKWGNGRRVPPSRKYVQNKRGLRHSHHLQITRLSACGEGLI
jgi:hypothetical protein